MASNGFNDCLFDPLSRSCFRLPISKLRFSDLIEWQQGINPVHRSIGWVSMWPQAIRHSWLALYHLPIPQSNGYQLRKCFESDDALRGGS